MIKLGSEKARAFTPMTTVAAQMVLAVEDTADAPGDPGDAVRVLLYPGETLWVWQTTGAPPFFCPLSFSRVRRPVRGGGVIVSFVGCACKILRHVCTRVVSSSLRPLAAGGVGCVRVRHLRQGMYRYTGRGGDVRSHRPTAFLCGALHFRLLVLVCVCPGRVIIICAAYEKYPLRFHLDRAFFSSKEEAAEIRIREYVGVLL